MSTTPRRPRGHRSHHAHPPRPARYHDDLPDVFEPLPSDPYLRRPIDDRSIDYLGIETPGELIDDAPVVLRDEPRHRRARYRATWLDFEEDQATTAPRRER